MALVRVKPKLVKNLPDTEKTWFYTDNLQGCVAKVTFFSH